MTAYTFLLKITSLIVQSAASDITLGNSTSGWKKWKTESGKTLEEVYRK